MAAVLRLSQVVNTVCDERDALSKELAEARHDAEAALKVLGDATERRRKAEAADVERDDAFHERDRCRVLLDEAIQARDEARKELDDARADAHAGVYAAASERDLARRKLEHLRGVLRDALDDPQP